MAGLLQPEDIRKLLAAQDFVAGSDAELEEITHRVNALMEGIRRLDHLGMNDTEPWPTLVGIVTNDF